MATKKVKVEIERPCADCHHLHEGKCTEDGCDCEVSRVAEVPSNVDALVAATADTIEDARSKMSDEEREDADQKAAAILARAMPIPLQERIANLLEDYAVENTIPVGCELVIAGQCFAWNGERMTEVAEAAPEPPQKPSAIILSEDDKAKLRAFVAEQAKAEELPDGSVMLPLRIDADQIEILRAWAEGAGENWVSYAQRTVEIALSAVISGGAVAG